MSKIIHLRKQSVIDGLILPPSCMAGYFSMRKFKLDRLGREVETGGLPSFRNLILNTGLNLIGTNSDYLNICQLGSGSTPPQVTDGSIEAYTATHNTIQSSTASAQTSPPYYVNYIMVFRFNQPGVDRIHREVTIGNATTLFSRSLIKDSGGNPVDLSQLADEYLDITYEYRYYPNTTDFTGTANIDGAMHNIVARPCYITQTNNGLWQAYTKGGEPFSNYYHAVYNGAIGAITGAPSGVSGSASSVVSLAYSNNSYVGKMTATWGLNNGNVSGGVSAAKLKVGQSLYQVSFDPVIAKDATKELKLTISHSWARGV